MMALDQEKYLVSAGVSWSRRSPNRPTHLYYHGTGIDDRDDHVKWFWVDDPVSGSWIDIAVQDAATAMNPSPVKRSRVNGLKYFATFRARNVRRIQELQSRLRNLDSGKRYGGRSWDQRPPVIAFQVSLNGERIGRVAVKDPGSLSVNVFLKKQPERWSAYLSIHGGDHLRQRRWHWYRWPLRSLKLGDRARFAVVAPARLTPAPRDELTDDEPAERPKILAELEKLKHLLRTKPAKEAAEMVKWEKQRPKPRPYRRA